MAKTLIFGLQLLYGDKQKIEIPGFQVVQKHDSFTVVSQGPKDFYAQKVKNGFRLFPLDELGCIQTDKAITIPV